MSRYYEYSSATVNAPGCSYSNLTKYNMVSQSMSPPLPNGNVTGYYIVPNYNPRPSYDTLIKGGCGGCAAYPSIVSAYGEGADCCNTQYTKVCCQPACPPPCCSTPAAPPVVKPCCGKR